MNAGEEHIRMKKAESIIFIVLLFVLSFLRFGLLYGCIMSIAGIISWLLFRKKEDAEVLEKILLSTVVLTLWFWAVKNAILYIFFQEEDLVSVYAMLVFALPLTIALIVVLIKSKHPKLQQIAPISKYETDSAAYLKKLNLFNTLIHLTALGLCIYSFFIIPYDLLKDDSILLIIPASVLTLIITVSLFWGALYPENVRSQEKIIKVSKFALWLNILLGKVYAANLRTMTDKDVDKIFVRRWSPQGYYVLLILLMPFYTLFLGLPEYYGAELHSTWESFVYCVTNIPFVQINIILFILIYIVSYVPLTLYHFITEKTIISVETYKTVSLKQFFRRSIVMSGVFALMGLGLALSILFGGSNNSLTAQIEEHISRIQNSSIKIYSETASSEFTNEDYDNIDTIITGHLGAQSAYRIVKIEDTETDPGGEKYISATFAGYGENNEQIVCFIFRKYLTESNYHKIGEIELYLYWTSETLTKQDVAPKD
jgi:hypothetical protein